jgi:hypothetical protein
MKYYQYNKKLGQLVEVREHSSSCTNKPSYKLIRSLSREDIDKLMQEQGKATKS